MQLGLGNGVQEGRAGVFADDWSFAMAMVILLVLRCVVVGQDIEGARWVTCACCGLCGCQGKGRRVQGESGIARDGRL